MAISVRTINKISEAMEAGFTRERLNLFLKSYGIPGEILARHEGGKQVYSAKVLYELHDADDPELRNLLVAIVEGLLEGRYLNVGFYLRESGFEGRMRELAGLLEADGYKIVGDRLVSAAGEDVEREETVFSGLLKNEGMDEAVVYLNQSADNFSEGKYESANSMTRTLLEFVTSGIAERIAKLRGETPNLKGHANVRKYLRATLLDENEFQILSQFMSWCSSNGSHPGLSDENEARHRRVVTLSLGQYYLEKFRSSARQNPP